MPVRDVISNGQLNWGIFSHLISHDSLLSDVALPPSREEFESDNVVWSKAKNGHLFVKSVYYFLCENGWTDTDIIWKYVWAGKDHQTIQVFVWLAGHEALHRNELRQILRIDSKALCSLCGIERETVCNALPLEFIKRALENIEKILNQNIIFILHPRPSALAPKLSAFY